MTKSQKQTTSVVRTSAGLRDVIFDEIDAIRTGDSNPTRANAVAKLATGIVETVRMELEVSKYANSLEKRVTDQGPSASMPKPLSLSANG